MDRLQISLTIIPRLLENTESWLSRGQSFHMDAFVWKSRELSRSASVNVKV